MTHTQPFAGHEKVGTSLLTGAEMWLKGKVVPKVPPWLETYHLTLTTVLWSGLVIGFSVLARSSLWWLAGVSAAIALQYVTDLFDGAVGRHRNTGLVKWGYYMDHFFDYVFMAAIVIGYAIIAPAGLQYWFLFLLALTGGFMVNSFLTFAATNRFQIYFYGLGPTEFRILLIAVNTALVYTGTAHFAYTIPLTCGALALALAFLIWRTHRQLWRVDMAAKAEQGGPPRPGHRKLAA